MITSPYYFVPFYPKVFRPKWAPLVSQDIPFNGSLSGTLDIEVTTRRPLFIRGAAEKPTEVIAKVFQEHSLEPDERLLLDGYLNSVMLAGKPFIPGASLRGAIRNIMQIAACGSLKEVVDSKFSVRDLRSDSYKNKLVTQTRPASSKAQSGYLRKNGQSWELFPCKMARVEHSDLETITNKIISFKKAETALEKRNLWDPNPFHHTWKVDENFERPLSREPRIKIKFAKADPFSTGRGRQTGQLVFTGQAGRKHMEYFFYQRATNSIILADEEVSSFEDVHATSDAWETDYEPRFQRGEEIPVFYLQDETGFKTLGLTSMMRVPTAKSVKDGLTSEHKVATPDLVDTILGKINGKNKDSDLASRVSFSALECSRTGVELLGEKYLPSGGPKPSFFPNYLKQDSGDSSGNHDKVARYQDWDSNEISLAGWKRFAVRPDSPALDVPGRPNDLKAKFASGFRAIPAGETFKGRISYHNLLPMELGALLWVLTLGNENDGFSTGDRRHLIGGYKPFGLGSVSLKISEQSITKDQATYCREAFTEQMGKFCEGSETWVQCVRELLAISTPCNDKEVNLLLYPIMKMGVDNEFTEAKGGRWFLPQYSVRFKGEDPISFDGAALMEEISADEVEIVDQIEDGKMMHVTIVAGRRGKKQCQVNGEPQKYGLNEERKEEAQIDEKWLAKCHVRGHNTLFSLVERIGSHQTP